MSKVDIVADLEAEEHSYPRENLIIPLEYTKLLVTDVEPSEILIQDTKNQIYAKAIHGPSTLHFKGGNCYKGDIHKGMMHGKGELTMENGIIYKGDFQYNELVGQGEYFWPDGSYYKGDIKHGLRHGQGVFDAAGKKARYTGSWVNGQRTGKGHIVFPSGSSYEGDFNNGVKEGHGIFRYSSGNYYEGEFKDNLKEGQGIMYWLDTEEKYTGMWSKNQQNGFGCHLWIEKKGEKKQLRNRYEGQWLNGQRHGFGVFYYADGSRYEGEWVDNLKEGYGVFTGEDGSVLQGQFKGDKLMLNILDMPQFTALNFDDIPIFDQHSSNNTPTNTKQRNNNNKHSQRLDKTPSQRNSIAPPSNPQPASVSTYRASLLLPPGGGSVDQRKQSTFFKPGGSITDLDDGTKGSQVLTPKNGGALNVPVSGALPGTITIPPGTIKHVNSKGNDGKQHQQQAQMSSQQQQHFSSQPISSVQQQSTSTDKLQSKQTKELQDNPYTVLLDYRDLDLYFKDPAASHLHIDTILLRNNSLLIQWFRECSLRFESVLSEASFSMDLQQVWRFLKEIKVLGDSMSIAAINRLFAQGKKNQFKITMNEHDMAEEITLLKQIGRYVTDEERKDIRLLEFLSSIKKRYKELPSLFSSAPPSLIELKSPDELDEEKALQAANQGNVHSEKQVILFRHFVDILVRVAYFRTASPDLVHVELENIIEHHIKPWIENKKRSKTIIKNSFEDEIQVLNNKVQIMKGRLQDILNSIFEEVKKVNRTSKFGPIDETCLLKDIIHIVKETGLSTTDQEDEKEKEKLENDIQFIYSLIESHFDQKYTIAHIEVLIKEREKEREKENAKAVSKRNQKNPAIIRKKTPDFARMKEERTCKLLNTELIFSEFVQITLMYLIKQIKEHHQAKIDDDNLEKKLRIHLEKILKILKNTPIKQHSIVKNPPKQWPQSIKDLMKVELQKEKIRKAEQEKERKRREEERKKEQRERAQMMLQDINIPSDVEDNSFEDF